MGCKTGVHPSVDTGPAGVVEVPYRSCSTHLPVPRCFHPFLWVLHTIHHDQLTTNMPSASTTGATVPGSLLQSAFCSISLATEGRTDRPKIVLKSPKAIVMP
ncbi:hypothetical protein GOODEAATRI_034293 [Goodea atripinnis]|uniref:Uncharacterized protein n=1 Tax=Goodea atripinnis TaxID=208336 RepID=A0ABV0MYW7_9TELE